MSIKDVEEFYIEIERNNELQQMLKNIDAMEGKSIKSYRDVFMLVKYKIIPIAIKLGFNFDSEELLIYETKILKLHYKRITDDQFEDAKGGVLSPRNQGGLSMLMYCFSSEKMLDNIENQTIKPVEDWRKDI